MKYIRKLECKPKKNDDNSLLASAPIWSAWHEKCTIHNEMVTFMASKQDIHSNMMFSFLKNFWHQMMRIQNNFLSWRQHISEGRGRAYIRISDDKNQTAEDGKRRRRRSLNHILKTHFCFQFFYEKKKFLQGSKTIWSFCFFAFEHLWNLWRKINFALLSLLS